MATLRESFPRHFKECLAIDVPMAWKEPVTDMVVFVDALCKQDAYQYDMRWIQIKEKLGDLRVVYSFTGPYEIEKVIDHAVELAEKKCANIEILARKKFDSDYNTNT